MDSAQVYLISLILQCLLCFHYYPKRYEKNSTGLLARVVVYTLEFSLVFNLSHHFSGILKNPPPTYGHLRQRRTLYTSPPLAEVAERRRWKTVPFLVCASSADETNSAFSMRVILYYEIPTNKKNLPPFINILFTLIITLADD